MAKPFQQIRVGTLTADAVKAKTGKSWPEWCKILDKAGARMMDHRETALLLQQHFGLSRWWGHMLTVGYENERGIRVGEGSDSAGRRVEVTLAKIVPVPRAAVWAAWQDPGALARWLPEAKFEVSKTVPQKILHLEWPDDTHVAVRFYEQVGKTRVVVAHARLAASDAQRMQEYWSEALERLKAIVSR
jgi:uncharacterized protein YndB with AHSA1/START domain